MAIAGNAQHLHVKSFFAASVKEALVQAHRELGPDALLLATREAPPEARYLGTWEVVLGVTRDDRGPMPKPETDETARPAQGAIEDALAQLKAFMRALPAAPDVDSRIAAALIEAGVVPRMAHEIERAVRQRASRGTLVSMARPGATHFSHEGPRADEIAAEMGSRFDVCSGLKPVTAFVGPPGLGKTTMLVKLAVREGLRAGRSVRLISADTQRIGGAEQLRAFAAILGVPFQSVESTGALAQAVDHASSADLLLIDTPGYGQALQRDLGGELASFLGSRQDIDTHLVLTASTHFPLLRKLAGQYRAYRPSKLLFTRLDEAESLASVYCTAVEQKLPLSYFGNGQLIPEDLEAAGKDRVTDSLVSRLREDLLAVA